MWKANAINLPFGSGLYHPERLVTLIRGLFIIHTVYSNPTKK